MMIADVFFTKGLSSFLNYDFEAVRRGAAPNGYLFEGDPVLPGYDTIVQASEIMSILLVLEDGRMAQGDCVEVILAGYAGRDQRFRPDDHLETFSDVIRPALLGRDLHAFRGLAEELDGLEVAGRPLHTAIRYGVTQAVLDAVAQSRNETAAETVAREYGRTLVTERLPILSLCMRDNYNLHDRMILKRADILPHASFGELDRHIGRDGGIFLDYVTRFRNRVQEIGAADYSPRLHFDIYGSIGDLFDNDPDRVAEYLGRVADAVAPYDLMIESPIVLDTREAQIDVFGELRLCLARRGVACTIIADEWCNTFDDIKAWADAQTTDMVQIKTPDLGGLNNTIDAALYCEETAMPFYLGGTANETHQSARLVTQIGLATRPAFVQSKPGMGGDESYALVHNEMTRTLATVRQRLRGA